MKNLILGVSLFALAMAVSQVLLKVGLSQIGGFQIKNFQDLIFLTIAVLKNLPILGSMALMISSFFLWLFILSWFQLGKAFPLTALTYVFVALMSHFMLGEKLSAVNYFGIVLIAGGIFFLLYR